jgi:hypothetical protein
VNVSGFHTASVHKLLPGGRQQNEATRNMPREIQRSSRTRTNSSSRQRRKAHRVSQVQSAGEEALRIGRSGSTSNNGLGPFTDW